MVPEENTNDAIEPLRMINDKLLTLIKHLISVPGYDCRDWWNADGSMQEMR